MGVNSARTLRMFQTGDFWESAFSEFSLDARET